MRRPIYPVTARLLMGLLCLLLCGCAQHTAFLGGADIDPIPESQVPPVAIAEFRKAHPTASIEQLERILSNAPIQFRIRYREATRPKSEFIYSDCSSGQYWLYPDAVKDAFQRQYPAAHVDKVDSFKDIGTGESYYRLYFHTGGSNQQQASYYHDGAVFQQHQ